MTLEPVKSNAEFEAPSMRGRPGRLRPEHSAQITARITALSVALGVLFAIGKFFLWQESHSVGVLSSLVHLSLIHI